MIATSTCQYCDAVTPDFQPSPDALQAVVAALSNGSRSIAASEMKYYAQCSDEEARTWVDHLLACAHAWPNAPLDRALLARIDQAFGGVPRPDHFTDFNHCDECLEHDNTFRSRTRETLRREDLGNCGWDPVTFCGVDGIAYFFPALARFALLPDIWRDNDWYGRQLLSHLSWDAENNRFLAWCSPPQRAAVFALLEHMAATRLHAIEHRTEEIDLRTALAAWRPPVITSTQAGGANRNHHDGA